MARQSAVPSQTPCAGSWAGLGATLVSGSMVTLSLCDTAAPTGRGCQGQRPTARTRERQAPRLALRPHAAAGWTPACSRSRLPLPRLLDLVQYRSPSYVVALDYALGCAHDCARPPNRLLTNRF